MMAYVLFDPKSFGCILCGRPIPDERRWWDRLLFMPPRRICPPTVECYMGFAERIGLTVTEDQARDSLCRHGIDPGPRNREPESGR